MYNILDFGAIPDKQVLSTASIQRAIDTAHENGGGRVTVPTGEFLTGSIFLRSGVELHLEMGARLIASHNLKDYNSTEAYAQNYDAPAEEWLGKHLIMAIECDNVSLTGLGEIDASGDFFFEEPKFYPALPWMSGYGWRRGFSAARDKAMMRPGQVICFIESTNVTVTDITVRNSPCWTLFLHGCEQVRIRGIKVFNACHFGNTDGIDLDCCRYVTVSDCIIETGDDCITFRCMGSRLKHPRPCEYITVSNCVLSCEACAFRIGVGTGVIRHIRVFGITIQRAGTAIQYATSYSGHGRAEIEDVNFSDVSASDVSYPVKLVGDNGSVRNVTVQNSRFYAVASLHMRALENTVMENVTLRGIDFFLIPDELPLDERRRRARGEYPIEAIGVKNLTLQEVRLFAPDELLTHWTARVLHRDCENLQIRDCDFEA